MGKKERKDKKEKPLDKMTATELRKYALELGGITGVHGMNKEELLAAIKQVKGIVDEGKKAQKDLNVRELKQKVKELRAAKAAAYEAGESSKKINILRRRMSRMKKRTRRAA
uniref:Transcription termination factor Rho n=1 Tax=Desulfobacca acetoxidans TaxID=60893 RepID=A0A7V4G8H6_9BACT